MNNTIFLICGIIYRILLDIIYEYQISPIFSYMLMENHMTFESYIGSWFLFSLFLLPVYLFYKSRDTNYVAVIFVLFIFVVKLVPLTSLLAFQPQSIFYTCQQILLWLLLFFLLNKSKPITFNFFKPSKLIIGLIAATMSLAVILVSGIYAHFRLTISLDNVYDLRMEAREFNMPIILKYVYAAAANIIPVCIVYYIICKKKWAIIALAFIGVLNFSIAGSKSTLFRIFLSVGLFYIRGINFKKWIVPAFLGLGVIAYSEFLINNSSFISALLIRRALYIPNLLDHVYFNYLQDSDPFFFNTNKFTDIQFDIGREVFGKDDMRANNGFFTDAYVNLGFLGCLFYPLVYCILVRLLEGACIGKEKCIVVFSTFLLVTTLESTYFTTSLLTHGIFLMIISLYFMPSVSKNISNRNYQMRTK